MPSHLVRGKVMRNVLRRTPGRRGSPARTWAGLVCASALSALVILACPGRGTARADGPGAPPVAKAARLVLAKKAIDPPERFHFTFDPKTPLKELLPVPPKV